MTISRKTLDKLLTTLSVHLHAFALCEVADGWRLRFGAMDAVTIHYVLKGSGTLSVGAAVPQRFGPRSIMIVPAKQEQSLESGIFKLEVEAEQQCRLLDDGLLAFTAGPGDHALMVVCGTISANYIGDLGLFDSLTGPLVHDFSNDPIIQTSFEYLLRELSQPQIGTQAFTESLMKQCLILLLRAHLNEDGVRSPIFASLSDQRMLRAVAFIVEHPATLHTVESLATVARMSRSAFADHFSKTFGETPMDFVQRVRLRQAAQLLVATKVPIKVIASSIGYASRSSFSKLFKKQFGIDPKTYRATQHIDFEPQPLGGLSKLKASIDRWRFSNQDLTDDAEEGDPLG